MPLFWLCYRHNNQACVVIQLGASITHARMRAAFVGLEEGTFTEGHELDGKTEKQGDDWEEANAARCEEIVEEAQLATPTT